MLVGVAESLFDDTEENLALGVVLPEPAELAGDCFTSSDDDGYAFRRTGVPGVSEEDAVLSILSDLVDFNRPAKRATDTVE